ncbi:hypothetical protein CN686_29240, partial [Bacillus pseudomycoides]
NDSLFWYAVSNVFGTDVVYRQSNTSNGTHPVLVVARQTARNQIEITYDQPTDLESAINVRNYWIRNNLDRPAVGELVEIKK